jgi:hypothetical protein
VDVVKIQAHRDYLTQQALAHTVTAQATADYIQSTSEMTEQIFHGNQLRPDLAKKDTYAGWAKERQRVISQYGGDDELLGANIAASLAQHDAVRTPHLELRATKAISENARATAKMSADQAVQDIVNADNPNVQAAGIERMNSAYTGLRGNAMSDQAVHDGMAESTVHMVQGLGDKEVQRNPTGVLARLSGLTVDSPELAGLTLTERQTAIEEHQKANEQGLTARIAMKRDVIDADLDVAMATGRISSGGYLKLQEQRGKQKEVSLMKLAVANRLSEDDLANQDLSPEAYGKVLGTIHSTQDRIRLDHERKDKEQEKAVMQREGEQINDAYTALKNGELNTETLEGLVRQGTFTEHRDEYRALLNGLEAQKKAGGVGDVDVFNRIQRGLYMGVPYKPTQLTDPRLNWDQQQANLDLNEKLLGKARADHWSRQPEVEAQYKIIDRKHKISNSLFLDNPPPRVGNVQKMWTDLMDAAAARKEPLGPAAEKAVKMIDAAFPEQHGWKDLPQPTSSALKPWLESVTNPNAKTKLSPKQAAQSVQRMVQSGQLNLSDPTTREQVGRFLDILDVMPQTQEPVNAGPAR